MKQLFNLRLTVFLSLTLILSACGSSFDWKPLSSPEGNTPEAYLPQDLSLVMSYSLLDEDQAEAMKNLESNLKREKSFDAVLSETLDEETQKMMESLGDSYRFVFGLRQKAELKDIFFVATLQDPEKMGKVLASMKANETLSEYKIKNNLAYANADKTAYFMIEKDVLLMAARPDALIGMLSQKESLKNKEAYVEALKEHGADALFFAQVEPGTLQGLTNADSLTGISALVKHQNLSVHAEEAGLAFAYTMNADQEKMKKLGLSELYTPRKKASLAKTLPAEKLMAAYEMYDMQSSFKTLEKMGQENALNQWSESTKRFLGLPMEELMMILDKGILLSLHQNGDSVVPGLSLMIDASSDPDKAKSIMTTIQTQLSSLTTILEQSLPGAFRLDLASDEKAWNRLVLDMSKLPQAQANVIGAVLSQEPLELLFGFKEGKILISLASIMGEKSEAVLEKDDTYQALLKKMKGQEGQIYVDAQALQAYLVSLRSLREALGFEETEALVQLEDVLQGFDAFMASGSSSATGSRMDGFLQIKANE